MNTPHAKILTAIVSTTAMTGVALSLTGCAFIDKMVTTSADAWAVTYELSVDNVDGATVSNVAYRDTPDRATGQSVVKANQIDVSADGWKFDTLGVVGKDLSISAIPPEGVRATCKIMLDKTEVLATATSDAPGQPVRCEAVAPEFAK